MHGQLCRNWSCALLCARLHPRLSNQPAFFHDLARSGLDTETDGFLVNVESDIMKGIQWGSPGEHSESALCLPVSARKLEGASR